MHMDLHARNLSIANNWIMSTPSLSRMFTDIGRLITSLIPSISHASTFTTRIPLNLSWNQFINYHIIKFKYKYYMVSYYVFGITVNSTAYCIIQLAARVRCMLVRSFIAMRSSYCQYKWYQCNSILNGKLCGLLSMNHENDQLKFIWISLAEHIELIAFNLPKMIAILYSFTATHFIWMAIRTSVFSCGFLMMTMLFMLSVLNFTRLIFCFF